MRLGLLGFGPFLLRNLLVRSSRGYCRPILEEIPDRRLRIALLGRPNVGKSTLFNKLTEGGARSIVNPTPGVTRDIRQAEAKLFDMEFTVVDTPGLEKNAEIVGQIQTAAKEANISLMIADGKSGPIEDDLVLSSMIVRHSIPCLLVVNKCDNPDQTVMARRWAPLKLGKPIPISAMHSYGLDALHDALESIHSDLNSELPGEEDHNDQNASPFMNENASSLRLAIIGRPNAGKSTLFNALLGSAKSRISEVKGTTRDTIEVRCMYGQQKVLLADTAGLKKQLPKPRGTSKEAVATIDKLAAKRGIVNPKLDASIQQAALKTIRFANVVILLVDATKPLTKYDLFIAHHASKEGRCLVVAANKWDQIDKAEQDSVAIELEKRVQRSMSSVSGLSVVAISAQKGKNLRLLMDAVTQAYRRWNTIVDPGVLQGFMERLLFTSTLTKWADAITGIEQVATRPPTFRLYVKGGTKVRQDNERFVINALRNEFDMDGSPIRLIVTYQNDVIRLNMARPAAMKPMASEEDTNYEQEGTSMAKRKVRSKLIGIRRRGPPPRKPWGQRETKWKEGIRLRNKELKRK